MLNILSSLILGWFVLVLSCLQYFGLGCCFQFYFTLYCTVRYNNTKENVHHILLQLHIQCQTSTSTPSSVIFNSVTVFFQQNVSLRQTDCTSTDNFFGSLCHFSVFCCAVLDFSVVCPILSWPVLYYYYIYLSPPFLLITCSSLQCSCCTTYIYSVWFYSDLPVICCIFSISVSGAVSDSYWSAVSGSGSGVTSLRDWSHFLHTSSVGLTAGRLIHILAEVQERENNIGAIVVIGEAQVEDNMCTTTLLHIIKE